MNAPIRSKRQVIQFQDGEESINVAVELQPNNEYSAIDADNYDGPGSPMGWGFSQLSAIADLFERMPRAASDREDRAADALAAKWDHARDERKHSTI